MDTEKTAVRDFWNQASCGEDLYLRGHDPAAYEDQARARYALEPFILDFARFAERRDQRVLEIGVGLGADHQRFAQAGAVLEGIDLTSRAVEHTQRRLVAFGLSSRLQVADAESLPFQDNEFDCVYSWGVLHHSPNTPRAIQEVFRVLKPGGEALIMIYHRYSIIGLMLWVRYALFKLRPFTSLDSLYAQYLESPGTKAYSVDAARFMFKSFRDVKINIQLTHGDLLASEAGQRHRGIALRLAKAVWPRRLIKALCPNSGLFMLITARK